MGAIKKYIKARTTYAMRRAVRDIGTEVYVTWRHWSSAKKAPRFLEASPLKLNLGCARIRSLIGSISIFFDSAADLRLDVRRGWPFPDGSVSFIYSEHVFEHLDFDQEVPHMLSESLRVLQNGGVFDVGVPDTEWPLKAYGDPTNSYWLFAPTCHPPTCENQLDHINYHFRQGEQHKYAWDEESLRRSLHKAGFRAINRRPFDASLDCPSRKTGTLYMRAIK
jgi:predicted SAM-dependent methyltransferase